MNSKFKRTAATALSVLTATTSLIIPAASQTMSVAAKYGTGKNIVENLNRGISAINTGNGMLVSWRFLANDADDAEFKLYRGDELIYTSKSGQATCYLDKGGSSNSKYRVDYISDSKVVSSENCSLVSNKDYFDIPLSVPTGSGCTYSANDCSFGDVDGDGTYEIFVKWDPSNQKDNSQEGATGNVYIDCYTLAGKRLWRVDLGKNIRAGAHYTQFLVADFDCDGKAEMTCKTADGTVDGTGKVIGDGSKNYRNSKGYILDGPEYYTLFEGATGKALDTVNYAFPRGKVSDWGDNYGNRVDRFNGAVVYLDGQKPSAVSNRGYYTRMTVVAYDVVDKKLVERWKYDSGNDAKKGYHNGNHNCMPADVDNDGKQELVLGSTCIDDNGKLLWCNGQGHGDAMHLGDFLPNRDGLELWMCHEEKPWGVSLIDAKTGKNIFHKNHTKDTGRACCGNIYSKNPGAEFWGATGNDIFDGTGKTIATNKPAQNFMIYWDGDLEREILDGTKIDDYTDSGKVNRILTADGCAANNGSKNNPGLAADIMGDWREELVLRTSDSKYLRVYNTKYTTDVRLTTLMHDVQYRTQAAGEQNCYNQPAHPSFYLGSDEKLPERPAVTINGSTTPPSQNPTNPPVEQPTEAPTQAPTNPPVQQSKFITNMNVKDTDNAADWKLTTASQGGLVFGDRDYTYTQFPTQLNGAESLLTACDSKNATGDLAEFTAGAKTDVYVFLDTRVETENNVPSWLGSWEKTDMTAETSNDVKFSVYVRTVNQGEKITLGNNNMTGNVVNYTVFATDAQEQPATQPPIETHTQAPTQTPQGQITIYGDANCDGTVSISDATAILQSLGNSDKYSLSEQGKLNADVFNNGDGITTSDAVTIKKVDAGIYTLNQLPVRE
ncbi:MAG: hypothetical protein IKK66_02355 [Ruminococcus sp.]|nr:hypothetical protein [Ruminococcus sp.]